MIFISTIQYYVCLGHIKYYIREFDNSKTKISAAPAALRSSITFTISLFFTKLDTACPPSVSCVMVGERFPGVIFVTASRTSLLQLYDTMTNFLDVMYPSIRCFSKSTMSLCLVLGLVMSIDSVSRTVATISKPAAFIVVPVSTKSTTASANPRPHAASTLPPTRFILVVTPISSSNLSKNFFVNVGKLVTIRFPAKVLISVILLATGA
mmetsp:Transcript_17056/g.29348  ORF Transcript_17056/g.29348 Transcript_17056/m.29348 type:complete len:209 (-) Transcript_17056:482-1108(-)